MLIIKKNYYFLTTITAFLLSSNIHADNSVDDYLNLPLEQLLSMEVTSVSKKKQSLNEVAAAIYVITNEDIRRSGVTSIPEALRMAPGIQVARMDANKWAISSRGFNSEFSNKLLVMIDGRTVYSPSFSGVYWDAQDTMMDDIERIEVIRGPGATVWGSNAVNGVINVITKSASQTQDGLFVAGVGDEEKSFASLRYGTELDNNTSGRFYIKYNDRDSSYASGLKNGGDDWDRIQGGFRIDARANEKDTWTLQGDAYNSNENQTVNLWKDPSNPASIIYAPFFLDANAGDHIDSSGWNILGKWNRSFSDTSSMSLQIYYDYTERKEAFVNQFHDTLDIDFQHQFKIQQHDIIWGMEYRHIKDDFDNTFAFMFIPDSMNNIESYSAFIQDEIELIPEVLRLTIGSKFEDNEYTNMEIQPSARLLWTINERNTLWASVSRAVRSPSRLDISGAFTSFIVPLPPPAPPQVLRAYGNDDFKSEKLLAYELGYRFHPRENLSFDLATFYNEYNDLQNYEQQAPSYLSNVTFDNNISARSYGLELSTEWRPLEWWRIQSSYSYNNIKARLDSTSHDVSGTDIFLEDSSPQNQFSIRSMMDLSHNIALDLWVYYVDELKKTNVSKPDIKGIPDYTSFNMRVAWKPRKDVELSIVGQNLFDNHHPEFSGENVLIDTEVERSVYGQIRWSY